LLFALCGVLFFVGLGTGDLYRNEGLRALVASETLRTGSWLVPTLHGEPQLTKPPGMAVAIGLVSLPPGQVTAVSARLPSALAGCLAVFLMYTTFARLLGREAGLVAALLLPLSLLWLDRVPSAEIDLLQLAWVTGSMLFLLRAVEADEENRPFRVRWWWWQSALLCVAGGWWTKWTAPAFFYLTAGVFLFRRGRLSSLLAGPHLLAVVAVGLLCGGWLVWAGQTAGWDVLIDTVSREALQRLSPTHHPRPYPWGELVTFPLAFLFATLPGSAAALPAFRPGFADLWEPRVRALIQLLHAWLLPGLLFWTVVPGHRPRHALPLQPALAGLAALVWLAWMQGRLRWPLPGLRPWRGLTGLVLVWVAVKLGFTLGVVPAREEGRHTHTTGEQIAHLVPDPQPIYLCRLKDEGVLFYAHRATRRVADLEQVPAGGMALLTAQEWQEQRKCFTEEARLRDEQGDPLVMAKRVVRVGAAGSGPDSPASH
jgi:4-amino-4-deoxy-L-arabinose transferase-like glycosyltransferase